MPFIKYPSVENPKNVRIENFCKVEADGNCGESIDLSREEFVIMSKIDGGNFSLIFDPGKKCVVGSRNEVHGSCETCNLLKSFPDAYKNTRLPELVAMYEKLAEETGKSYNIYGELFGPHIQKRVWYGKDSSVRLFDMRIDGNFLPFVEFERIIGKDFPELLAPILKKGALWHECLNYDVLFRDPIAQDGQELKNNEGNKSEGIVFKPMNNEFKNPALNCRLILKRKNENFDEIKAAKTQIKQKAEVPQALRDMANEFHKYINHNRMMSCFSKIGPITNFSEISKFMPVILNDAVEDYEKEHEPMAKEERRYCCSQVSGEVASMLKKAVEEYNH